MKGISSTMGYAAVSTLSHLTEDLILSYKDKGVPLSDKLLKLIFEVLAAFDTFGRELPDAKSEPVKKLIARAKSMMEGPPEVDAGAASEPDSAIVESVDGMLTSIDNNVNIDVAMIDSLIDEVSELKYTESAISELNKSLDSYKLKLILKRNDALLTKLFHSLIDLKMQPFDTIIDQLKRAVNEYCLSSGKKIDFRAKSNNIEIDSTILKQLISPLIHLIRNAVDHGIEPPEERRSLNKPERGTISLDIKKVHDFAEIRVRDDGSGLPVHLIIKGAFERGYLKDIPERVDSNLLLFILTRPGFTTRDEVSMISGRGLGLDVVRSSLENIGGNISLETKKDVGTEIVLRVPVTTAVIRSLLVRADDSLFSIPSSAIEKVLSVSADSLTISSSDKNMEYKVNDSTVSVEHLSSLLNGRGNNGDSAHAKEYDMLLVTRQNRLTGILVDELIREEDLFVKPLPRPLKKMDSLLGYSILGNGSPVFVLDLNSL